MGDETPQNSMNLDLNLGPVVHPSEDDTPETMNLEDWLDGPTTEAGRNRTQARRRWRSLWRPVPIPLESRNMALELIGGSGLETGEGSVAASEERPPVVTKTCDNSNACLENEAIVEKDFEKINEDEGSFFDCNICLDLASEPVVTCCGHLFCWPCLYQWLHIHSDAQECPICKGEVTIKTLVPIYGRGNPRRVAEEDSSLKIPDRPQAKRAEGWRQTLQRNSFTAPMEEMIRRLGGGFDLVQDLLNAHTLLPPDYPRETPERTNSLVNRILASRRMRREEMAAAATATASPSDGAVESARNSPSNSGAGEGHRLSSLLPRRSNRVASMSNLTSARSAETFVELFLRNHQAERNQEGPPTMDDRDSVSSIAAIIQSESQTVDNAAEIDSRVSPSTSSIRRRSDAPGVSDVDSGDSRAPRRRRLQ